MTSNSDYREQKVCNDRPDQFDPCWIVPTYISPEASIVARNETPNGEDDFFLKSTRQKYGYADVRPNAHIFWWLFYSTHTTGYENRPLVMWLQGGPGAGSSGHGVFEIIGPFDINGNTRQFTWIQEASVLFVDNPVGAGFSYVDTTDAYTKDVDQIAVDLTTFVKEFMRKKPEFKSVPFYIFGESYGGKMATAATLKIHQEIEAGGLECNLKGFAMGNSWIHPVDSTITWGPLLYWMSVVDDLGLDRIQAAAEQCKGAVDAGKWANATLLWMQTQMAVREETNRVDFYNVLKYQVSSMEQKRRRAFQGDNNWYDQIVLPGPKGPRFSNEQTVYPGSVGELNLQDFMNTQVREHLEIIPEAVMWGEHMWDVIVNQYEDFMKDVVGIVDDILKTTDLQVVVYEGQLDLICNTVGTMNWVQRLTWDGLTDYNGAKRKALVDPETKQTDSFVKAHENFKFYWVLNSGHSAPADAAFAGLRMLQRIVNNVDR